MHSNTEILHFKRSSVCRFVQLGKKRRRRSAPHTFILSRDANCYTCNALSMRMKWDHWANIRFIDQNNSSSTQKSRSNRLSLIKVFQSIKGWWNCSQRKRINISIGRHMEHDRSSIIERSSVVAQEVAEGAKHSQNSSNSALIFYIQ